MHACINCLKITCGGRDFVVEVNAHCNIIALRALLYNRERIYTDSNMLHKVNGRNHWLALSTQHKKYIHIFTYIVT